MKKILSLLLALMIITSVIPTTALASDTITITFAAYDSVNGEFLYIPAQLDVTTGTAAKYGFENSPGYVAQGQITAMDAFVAAHEEMFAEDEIGDKWEGLATGYAIKMFGLDRSISFMINDQFANDGFSRGYAINEAVINDGDVVCFFTYTDYMLSDYYSYFNMKELTVAPGEEFTLTLSAFMATELMWAFPGEPTPESPASLTTVAGAQVITLDKESGAFDTPLAATNDDGEITLSFEQEGTYYVSATGIIEGMYGPAPLVAPWCIVTVKDAVPTYDVTVKVAPKTASVDFYTCAGFDENKMDLTGDKISATDMGEADNYHIYSLSLPQGRYSYRAKDENGASLGGMTFTVPPANSSESTEYEITLRQVDIYTTTKYDGVNYATENEYTTTVMDHEEYCATAGDAYLKGSYTRYPYMLCALGGPLPYAIEIIPDTEIAAKYSLGTNTMSGYAVNTGTSILTKTGALPTLINTIINAPKGATVQVFNQIKNYYNEEVACSTASNGENGTVNYTYRLPKGNGNHTYKVSMEGKITRAGYLNISSEEAAKTTVVFEENENPKIRPAYDRSTPLGKVVDDSIVLNINKQNYLRLNEGEEFTARAFRTWQIINSDTANIMIEPDFHYNILSGDSVIINQQGSKAILKTVKEGISIIEVTYDAIYVTGSPNYSGLYGAIAPDRTGMFVVNVGGDASTAINMTGWDSDFDTVYFLDESGVFNFAPSSKADMTVQIDGSIISPESDGSYNIPIKCGNNIISVTAADSTEYIIVKGSKITAKITNKTNPEGTIFCGDTIEIDFDGLHAPIPKMGGVYNPGFGGTTRIEYTLPNGDKLTGKGVQYTFITDHTISYTADKEGKVVLTGGCIPMTSMGMEFGGHRKLTDMGVPANFNASSVQGVFSVLPDLELDVFAADKAAVKEISFENNIVTATIISPEAKDVNAFVCQYNGDILGGIVCTSTSIGKGESIISIDCTDLTDKDNLYMLIWDENMTEITDKTPVNIKD